MEKTLLILMIVAIFVFFVSIISIIILSNRKKVLSLIYKMSISEDNISENLNRKLELITRAINIIERELKIESKYFEEVKRIKKEKSNYIALDNILKDANKEIIDFKSDYKNLENIKSFNEIADNLKELDVLLNGAKKYYNKYATLYNNRLRTFPTSMICKKFGYKNLYSENNNNEIKIDFTSL